MEHPRKAREKGFRYALSNLRELVPGIYVRVLALCVFPKHASSEGPVPHSGLVRVLGLAVWASAKRGAGVRRRATALHPILADP